MRSCNSFTLSETDLEEGIRCFTHRVRGRELQIGPERLYAVVKVESRRRDQMPECTPTHLIRAMPDLESASPKLVLPIPTWKGILIRIQVRNLDFRAEPFVQDLNLNPGGEGPNPYVQRGSHNDRFNKDQLFYLEHDQQLLVADQKRAVMVITCRNGVPVMRPAEKRELIAHILAYGLSTRGHSQIAWAMHTIERLDMASAIPLKERLRKVARS